MGGASPLLRRKGLPSLRRDLNAPDFPDPSVGRRRLFYTSSAHEIGPLLRLFALGGGCTGSPWAARGESSGNESQAPTGIVDVCGHGKFRGSR